MQAARNERRRRIFADLLQLHLGHAQFAPLQFIHQAHGQAFFLHLGLFAIDARQTRHERRARLNPLGRLDAQHPIRLRLERLNRPLALAHQPQRHRLHTPRAGCPRNPPPQHRADLIAHHAVENAPRLLAVHALLVNFARLAERLANGRRRNFVVGHPAELLNGHLVFQRLAQMPGNRLAFAVGVGREIHGIHTSRRRLQLTQHFRAALNRDILRRKSLINVHTQRPLGQIAHVAQRSLDHILRSQQPLNGFGFGGRFYNH